MTRKVRVVTHQGRPEAREATEQVTRELRRHGIVPIPEAEPADDVELVIVLGGDGTILRAAEAARDSRTPLIGVNLGHVGFLAEAEQDALSDVVDGIAERRYTVEERLTVDLTITQPDGTVVHDWALNEAAVEKSARERMIEVTLGVDGRGVSSFGCDGVIMATPTGSTAYAFSAGGPIVWPDVEAFLVVPIAAHALFSRPMVLSPSSVIELEIQPYAGALASVYCDGRRRTEAPAGSRIEVRRGANPVRLARLTEAPFSARLVAKFDLPVLGWRAAVRDRT